MRCQWTKIAEVFFCALRGLHVFFPGGRLSENLHHTTLRFRNLQFQIIIIIIIIIVIVIIIIIIIITIIIIVTQISFILLKCMAITKSV